MRIAFVSDAPPAIRALRRWIGQASKHRIVWTASNVTDAVGLAGEGRADLVLLDLRPGGLDVSEATRRIMTTTPCPILIVTNSVRDHTSAVFEAMGHGALDAVEMPAPEAASDSPEMRPLLARIARLSRLISDESRSQADHQTGKRVPRASRGHLVAIGASAGGPAALATLISGLPEDFPAAIVIVQHVDAQFASGLAGWLGQHSRLPVRLARGGEIPSDGTVFVAGGGNHLIVTRRGHLGYSSDPDEHVYRPSIDVFFKCVRREWPGTVTGVLLTGMGRDGAAGLKELRDHGCHTIAQDEATSALYGMPKAAAAIGAAADILPIGRISGKLIEIVGGRDARTRGVGTRLMARTFGSSSAHRSQGQGE